LDHVDAANVKRRALVQMTGGFRQDSTSVVFRTSACVDSDESKGVAFVHEAEFSFGVSFRAGVQVNSTFDEVAVKISHQTSDVARF